MDKDLRILDIDMPKHIAVIPDGNRRWAKAQGKPAGFGHKQGAKTLEQIVRYANKIGLKYITVYAFSTENWKRSEEEVSGLMMLLQMTILLVRASASVIATSAPKPPSTMSG